MNHNRSTYMKYKCRCTICVASNSEYNIRYKKERKVAAGADLAIRLDATPLLMRLAQDGITHQVSRNIRRRWIENGIDLYRADEACIKLGYHPIAIFGQSFYEGCTGDIDF